MLKKVIGALGVLLITAVPSPVSASEDSVIDEPVEKETHCWWQVERTDGSDELVVVEEICYDTAAEVSSAVFAARTSAGEKATLATFTIGRHYTGANYTGSSITVTGSDCAGGYVNMSAAWNNVLSSTMNGCNRIRHYDGFNMVGVSQYTYSPGGNLTTLNDRTSSIQYLT